MSSNKVTVSLTLLAAFFIFPFTLTQARVRSGADRILENPYLDWIQGKRVGLITNPTGVNSQLVSTWEAKYYWLVAPTFGKNEVTL